MSETRSFFLSSIGKKVLMSLTGLFLCLFLVGHLSGNLLLFVPGEAGMLQFNEYAKFMTSNPAVKVLSYLTYFSIVFHAIDGIALTLQNRRARPQGYAKTDASKNSSWASRNMAVLGTLILVYLIIHMRSFWAEMHWGDLPLDINGNRDLHTVVIAAFQQLWYTALYVAAMALVGFHLYHGFQSGFQSLGLNHKRYTPLIKKLGVAFAILIPLAFAAIPVYIYLVF